jgi:CheY-like chemotaxis protein
MPSRHVLLVDDDDMIREVAQLSLEAVGGWQTTTAASGREALTHVAAQRPDAILLDVMMPGMDGPSTVAALQADPDTQDIAVILLTAKVQAAERAGFAALPGVVGVITKPFDPMTLPEHVASILGWSP